MLDQISLSVKLDAVIKESDGVWVATCPALDVWTQAESPEMVLSALTEAVEGWFESCLDRNVLEQALIECGFSRIPKTPVHESLIDPSAHWTIECSVPAYAMSLLDRRDATG